MDYFENVIVGMSTVFQNWNHRRRIDLAIEANKILVHQHFHNMYADTSQV